MLASAPDSGLAINDRRSELMQIICLLPVRNGSQTLARYFSSVAAFCDGVIALDDGSTDNTPDRLAAEPLVLRVLANPPRETYAGWDDRSNRTRLLEACDPIAPDWILWLDADEEIPRSDAARIRPFLEKQALRDAAYGLEVLRLVNDHQKYDLGKLWAFRLLPFRPGYELPVGRLHFEPVPVQIPRSAWRRTRLRIAHSAGMTAQLRAARLRKYREADPLNEWQDTYDHIVAPVGHVWELRELPEGLDLLVPRTSGVTP